MVYLAKTIISGRQRVLYFFAAALALAMPAVILHFAEVILAFLLAGAVPGTDIIVPPDVMIWSVTGLFTFSAAAFVWRKARMARHRRMHIPIIVRTEADENPPRLTMASEEVVLRTRIKRSLRIRAVGRRIRGAMSSGMTLLDELTDRIFVATVKTLRVVLRSLDMFLSGAYRAIRVTLRIGSTALVRISSILLRYTKVISIRTWQWAKPRLLIFDAWLELQVRTLESKIRAIRRSGL